MSNTPDRTHDTDERFAARLAEHYQPRPLDRAQRARFDAALRERISERRRAPVWIPALAGAAAALSLTLWLWPAATPQADLPVAVVGSDWEVDVLLTDSDTSLATEDAYLPDDYVALAFAFIDEP